MRNQENAILFIVVSGLRRAKGQYRRKSNSHALPQTWHVSNFNLDASGVGSWLQMWVVIMCENTHHLLPRCSDRYGELIDAGSDQESVSKIQGELGYVSWQWRKINPNHFSVLHCSREGRRTRNIRQIDDTSSEHIPPPGRYLYGRYLCYAWRA